MPYAVYHCRMIVKVNGFSFGFWIHCVLCASFCVLCYVAVTMSLYLFVYFRLLICEISNQLAQNVWYVSCHVVFHTHKHITSITRGIQFWFGYVFGLFIHFSPKYFLFDLDFGCRVDFHLSIQFDATPNTMPLYIQQYMKHDKHRMGSLLSVPFSDACTKIRIFSQNCEFVILNNKIYRNWHRHRFTIFSMIFKRMSAEFDEPAGLSIVNKTCDPIRIRSRSLIP